MYLVFEIKLQLDLLLPGLEDAEKAFKVWVQVGAQSGDADGPRHVLYENRSDSSVLHFYCYCPPNVTISGLLESSSMDLRNRC